MKNKKIRLGIIFGGKSSEHEVSLQSAKSIIEALDKNKYELVLIGIDRRGQWFLHDNAKFLLNENNPSLIKLNKSQTDLVIMPGMSKQISTMNNRSVSAVDVFFPVLHGPMGEDGTMQGLLKLLDVPFVGPDVLGSAIGMDKDVMKRLFRDAKISISDFMVIHTHEKISYVLASKKLGKVIFIKPANAGSSVGVNKVTNQQEFKKAITEAFKYDHKILLERAVKGREIECSVLGNENPIASVAGEVIPKHDFYSYKAKYIDENGAAVEIPAKLSKKVMKEVQRISVQAYKVLCLEGMARVDMFVTKQGKIVINEVNTIPGFTKISMYPKLWEASGLTYPKLLDTLIMLAIQRHKNQKKLSNNLN